MAVRGWGRSTVQDFVPQSRPTGYPGTGRDQNCPGLVQWLHDPEHVWNGPGLQEETATSAAGRRTA